MELANKHPLGRKLRHSWLVSDNHQLEKWFLYPDIFRLSLGIFTNKGVGSFKKVVPASPLSD
ncbi:MAG: hypothetical protein ABFD10_03830 [Prolixibacteraceae bacterium]